MNPDLSMEFLQNRLEPVTLMAREVSHALGTPLSVIMSHSSRMTKDAGLGQDWKLPLQDISDMTDKCVRLQHHLGSLTRTSPVRKEPLCLREMIEDLSTQIPGSESITSQIDLSVEPSENQVMAERSSFSELVRILIENAFDSMDESGVLQIKFSRNIEDSLNQIQFIDQGNGIEKSILPKIFDPYFTTKDRAFGRGLSLTRAFIILTAHQGRIDVFQRERGSEFRISLPR